MHQEKNYKPETLFAASNILDHYLYKIGIEDFRKKQMINLATVSILMAAKLEEPISPSFTRMISMLSEDEQDHVTK